MITYKNKSLMKEKILVTGGTGYIGSHTVVELQNAGYEVVIIDNLSNSSADVVDNIEKVSGIRPAFEKLNCLDFAGLDAVFTKYKGIKAIIHFAASKAVGESVQKPLLYYRNNLVSLINLLELMPKHGVEGIVFSSSCTVYVPWQLLQGFLMSLPLPPQREQGCWVCMTPKGVRC